MERTKENTVLVYWDGRKAYLRLVPFESVRFPHGVSLATTVEAEEFEVENFAASDPKDRDEKMAKAKEEIEAYREDVWQYLKKGFNL